MRQETNKEMDLLLRRLGRRDGATVPDAAGGHLDADELSSYAENAVPAAARARYTAHLAECRRCRDLVVQLSASAGVVHAAETATVSKPSVWRTFLASLFTPMVLRYAAPALGLIIVAAIGFVILRRDRPADSVAQVTNNEQRPVAAPPAQTASSPAFDSQSDASPATPPASAGKVIGQKDNLQTEAAPAGNAAPVVTSAPTEVSKDAAAAQPKVEQQPSPANEPPPPKPAPTPADENRWISEEAKKKEAPAPPTAAAASPASQNRAFRMQEREDQATRGASNKAGTADTVRTQAGVGSVESVRRERMSEKDDNAETRSVAGRRFRKRCGIWIDTAYDSSRDTMTITRGSEQYRALIADEPEIKRIADELGGEIIVIWKSRAYRIR